MNGAPSKPDDPLRPVVYFDGSCPLCLREIGFYRRRRGAEAIDWVDVSRSGDAVAGDLSCQVAMRRFHVRGRDGVLYDGGDAFLTLWKVIPAFRWIGLLLSPPPFRWLANRAYEMFLQLRPTLQRLTGVPRHEKG